VKRLAQGELRRNETRGDGTPQHAEGRFARVAQAFEIVFFNDFLATFHRKSVFREMSLCEKNLGGSIWIRRI
jgi:hypothetical protein